MAFHSTAIGPGKGSDLVRGLPHCLSLIEAQVELPDAVRLLANNPDWHCTQSLFEQEETPIGHAQDCLLVGDQAIQLPDIWWTEQCII